MNKKILLTTLASTALFLTAATPVHANAVPDFSTCLNPQWTKTQQNLGSNHGVIGIGSFSGTDTIYESNGNVLQCLCTSDGKGYQTNWLKADNMSTSQKEELQSQGWIYVAYGEDWGLHKSAYMAKNSEYTCADCTPTPTTPVTPTVTSVPGPTATPAPTTKTEEKTENNVLGGLAPTGNALAMYLAILAGVGSLITGFVLRKSK